MHNSISSDTDYSIYRPETPKAMPTVGPIGLLSTVGNEPFVQQINDHLVDIRLKHAQEAQPLQPDSPGFLRSNYMLKRQLVRFQSGEGKATLSDTIRGHDLFILADVTNRAETFRYFHQQVPYAPDDHMQDIKRMILASSGKANRIHVIMPYLYQGQDDLRRGRESLACATMLKDLMALGVSSIITFEPHEPRVENAIPKTGLEIIPVSYIMIKRLLEGENDLKFDVTSTIVVSPNESNIKRAIYFASNLGLQLGTFFRQRDYSSYVVGRNPIVSVDYLGDSVAGKDVLLIDDMIITGRTMIETARQLRQDLGAKRVLCVVSYPLMTEGIDAFKQAHEDGIIDRIYGSNLIYRPQELLDSPWYVEVDASRLVAQLIDAINHNASISELIDQTPNIQALLKRRREQEDFQNFATRS